MQALSIHIGLNRVDPVHYQGWSGPLRACEADAQAMATLARAEGISPQAVLLTADATYDRIMRELRTAAATLQSGDYLLLTFAGHGASYEDIPMPGGGVRAGCLPSVFGRKLGDEDDGLDEAWCVYDTYVLDDELHDYFCTLALGVRVCVVSDSCFSGTITRAGIDAPQIVVRRCSLAGRDEQVIERERRLAPRHAEALYRHNFRGMYQARKAAAAATRTTSPGAHIILLAACQDNQAALEGDDHGLFTEHLLEAWAARRGQVSHAQLIAQLTTDMPQRQKPNLFITGARSPAFESSPPFTPR